VTKRDVCIQCVMEFARRNSLSVKSNLIGTLLMRTGEKECAMVNLFEVDEDECEYKLELAMLKEEQQ
jgi:hypothetical protein